MTVGEHASMVWRGVRSRGWRAALTVGLLGVALAANTIVFSAADSFVFDRVPYASADRLVEIASRDPQNGAIGSPFISAPALEEWQRQRDVFADVQAYLTKTLFLTGAETVRTPVADVTPGLIELLGAAPRWGRSIASTDAAQVDPQIAVISEGLARERFGDPARAVGQTLRSAARPLLVVGVMPARFAFPDATVRLWRALDPRGPLTKGFAGVHSIARLADGIPFEAARAIVQQRSPDVGRAAASRRPYTATLTALPMTMAPETQRRLFLIVLGTAICLLLTACANVASLEIAGAIARTKTHAIHLALGASRRRLAAVSLAEGLLLVVCAAGVGALMARAGATALSTYLPDAVDGRTVHRVAFDARALAYMAAASFVTWLLASLPLMLFAARANVVELLNVGGHSTAAPRGARLRRLLTAAELAAAVFLLAGTALYARTYVALVGLDKGFDTANVAVIKVSLPAHVYPTVPDKQTFARAAIGRLEAAHAIVSGMWGSPPPDAGARYRGRLQVDGGPTAPEEMPVGSIQVAPSYFSTLGIPVQRGRAFHDDEEFDSAIVNASMAAKIWPGQDAIGHRFRWDPGMPWLRVIGVVADVRTEMDRPDQPRGTTLQVYEPVPHAAVAAASPTPEDDNGGMFGSVDMVVRIERPPQLAEALRLVRQIEPRGQASGTMLDDEYAARYADRLLAARVIGGFGVLAFVIAGAGIYGLMTFLVALRAREMGIRMALGADARAIRALVMRSSALLFLVGVGGGAGAAVVGSRALASQPFGVTPADPATWTGVIGATLLLAATATWRPARAAARIDPSVLLRS